MLPCRQKARRGAAVLEALWLLLLASTCTHCESVASAEVQRDLYSHQNYRAMSSAGADSVKGAQREGTIRWRIVCVWRLAGHSVAWAAQQALTFRHHILIKLVSAVFQQLAYLMPEAASSRHCRTEHVRDNSKTRSSNANLCIRCISYVVPGIGAPLLRMHL